MDMNSITTYTILKQRFIKEIDSQVYLLKHNKTKANIIVMSNSDNNKTFSIGFKTPPTNNTGVEHIIEHSVLCGSKKFPAKKPFVELMKASLNTFLNAMTFADKTLYPVASCNEKDFMNLVNVYLDAVFYPNIYIDKKIFLQEGWHYELENKEDDILINGVVYNEMKGDSSSPISILLDSIERQMLPDTCYAFKSGGIPESIISLSYDEFIDYHKNHYHPSNSYIVLYGDGKWDEILKWIDKEYLSKFDYKENLFPIKKQKEFDKKKYSEVPYSLGIDEEINEKCYLSKNFLIDCDDNPLIHMALNIIASVLFNIPGARIKQSLLDMNICKGVNVVINSEINQHLFSVIVNGSEKEKLSLFEKTLNDEFIDCVNKGIDRKQLLSSINIFEFLYRESDYGNTPKGIAYTLIILETWLYGKDPFERLETDAIFSKLKKLVNTNFYEKLIEKSFINNKNEGLLVLYPSNVLGKERIQNLNNKLRLYKESLSDEMIEKIIEETKELKKYQSAPSRKEDLDKMPFLSCDDLKITEPTLSNDVYNIKNVKVIHHDYNTNNIGYLKLLFNVKDLSIEMLPYVKLLSLLLGKISTKNYTYSEISIKNYLNTGGINFSCNVYDGVKCDAYLTINASAFNNKYDYVFEIINEIISNTVFSEKKRIKELIIEYKEALERSFISSGNYYSQLRALSYITKSNNITERISGISFYKTLEELIISFDTRYEEIKNSLESIINLIFRRSNLLVSYTSNKDCFLEINGLLSDFIGKLNTNIFSKTQKENLELIVKNEGFKTSSICQYVSRVGNFKLNGYKYTPKLEVLKVILNTEYLWNKVRLVGGAYGCSCHFDRNGDVVFSSYRDPHLKKTFDAYEEVLDFIANFNVSDEEMTKYIIGAFGNRTFPMNSRIKGEFDLNCYFQGIDNKELANELQEIITTKAKDIRSLYPLLKSALDRKVICVIGNENKIEDEGFLFKSRINLFKQNKG